MTIIIIHAFRTRAHSIVVLNQRCWQSLCGQHGKGVWKGEFSDGIWRCRKWVKVSY